MNEKSMTESRHPSFSIVARAADDGVAEAGGDLGFRKPLGVRAKVEERERVGRAQLGVLLGERARIGQLLDPLPGADREVMAALRADAKVLGELVVAVVRPAAGAGVGVRLLGRRVRCLLRLDRHVDALLTGGHAADPTCGLAPARSQPGRRQKTRDDRSVSRVSHMPGDADSGERSSGHDVSENSLDLSIDAPSGSGTNTSTAAGSSTSRSSAT